MDADKMLNPDLFFDYLWVGLGLYILVAIIASLSLFYNWQQYTGHKGIWFRIGQTTFLIGIALLIMIASVFYLKI